MNIVCGEAVAPVNMTGLGEASSGPGVGFTRIFADTVCPNESLKTVIPEPGAIGESERVPVPLLLAIDAENTPTGVGEEIANVPP